MTDLLRQHVSRCHTTAVNVFHSKHNVHGDTFLQVDLLRNIGCGRCNTSRNTLCNIIYTRLDLLYYIRVIQTLSDRRDTLCRDFFRKLLNPSNCIHHLLPPPHNTEITSRLRRATTYPRLCNGTNCYKSFIHQNKITYSRSVPMNKLGN